MIRAMTLCCLVGGLLLAASPASAHAIAPQYAVFDAGALRALTAPRLLVPLIGLGVALGQRSWPFSAAGGIGAAVAFALGAVAWNQPGNPLAGLGTPLAFLAAGASLMATGRLGAALTELAAVCIGAYGGGIARQEGAAQGSPGWFTIGLGVGGALVVFFSYYGSARYNPIWLGIARRVLASWMIAIAVMLFGLALRSPGPDLQTGTEPADISPCPGPHRHAPDGEVICLSDPKADKPGTPASVVRPGAGTSEIGQSGPPRHRTQAAP